MKRFFYENNERMALKVTNFIAVLESKLTDVLEDFLWSDEKEKQLLSYLNAIKSTFNGNYYEVEKNELFSGIESLKKHGVFYDENKLGNNFFAFTMKDGEKVYFVLISCVYSVSSVYAFEVDKEEVEKRMKDEITGKDYILRLKKFYKNNIFHKGIIRGVNYEL